MKFIHLHVENFCSIESLDLPLDNQGMVLILGENRDSNQASSNGAGKSLCLEALCWTLWGQTVRGLKDDAVINRWKQKGCYAEVTVRDGDTEYKIVRSRKSKKTPKPNDLLLFRGDEDLTGASTKLTQEKINDLLGLDFRTFQIMMPGAGVKAAELTDANVKDLLERLMQTEVLSQAQELAKAEAKALNLRLAGLKSTIAANDKAIEKANLHLDNLVSQESSFDEETKTLVEGLEAKLDSLNQKLANMESLIGDSSKLELKEASLKEDLKGIRAEQAEIRAEFVDAQLEIETKLGRLQLSQGLVTAKIEDTQNAIAHINELGAFCSHCNQNIDPAFKETQLANLRDELDNKLIVEQSQLAAKIFEAFGSTKNLKLSYDLKLQRVKDREDAVISSLDANTQMLKNMAVLKERYSAVKKDITLVESQLETTRGRVSPFRSLIEKTQTEAVALVSDNAKTMKEAKDTESDLERVTFWVNGFSSRGMRSYMLKHVTPILNSKAAEYCDLLTGGEMQVVFHTQRELSSGDIKEEFNIEVTQEFGGTTYEGASKGERSRADLVISYALGDLASLRAHKILPFRFLDEPFESVDEVGTEAIVRLLHDQRDKYETVFVITHNDHFKQLFSKKICMVKSNKVSRLEVVP